MARWKPLPDDVDPHLRQLVVRLRELKDQTGLGAAALARKTAYSRSSWQRYLNATLLPPQQAVEALGLLAGTDLARLMALWELAERAGTDRGAEAHSEPVADSEPAADSEPVADSEPPADVAPAAVAPWRRRRIAAVTSGIAIVTAIGLTVWLTAGRSPSSRLSPASRSASYACDYTTRDGRTYAGHSSTSDRLVALNAGSEDVVEVQCLLKHRGMDPGRIDGLFGKRTEQAVEELQRANGLVADGIVGPRTWAVLRA